MQSSRTGRRSAGGSPEFLGVSGYRTFQELQTLKRFVWRYQPDLVEICQLTGNAFQSNCREMADKRDCPYLELREGEYREVLPEVA